MPGLGPGAFAPLPAYLNCASKTPLPTRRWSTRATPRGGLGNDGWIIDHATSVRSHRAITKLPRVGSSAHISPIKGIPFIGTEPRPLERAPIMGPALPAVFANNNCERYSQIDLPKRNGSRSDRILQRSACLEAH